MGNRDHRTGSAREDWNLRAREDFRHAIMTTTAGDADEELFSGSGAECVRMLMTALADRDPSSWRALEYGCGVGRIMIPLLDYVERVDGVDISDEMIRLGRERNKDRSEAGFHLVEGGKLPFANRTFDLVYSAHVFQHMPRNAFREILPEIARVLVPDGRFVFQLTRPFTLRRRVKALLARDDAHETFRRRYYTRSSLDKLLAQAGLVIEHTVDPDEVHPKHVWHRARLS